MGDETHVARGVCRLQADAEVAAAARAADWVLTTAELLALGLTQRQIEHRARVGALYRRHRGVYAVGRPDLDFRGRCRAALLACGPQAAISHDSAARLWDLRGAEGPVHVTVPRGRRGHAGLRVHRPLAFAPEDVTVRGGIAVTTIGRTLVDVAAREPAHRVERLIHEALVQRVLDAREVYGTLQRHERRRGAAKVAAALHAEHVPTRSGLERAYRGLCRRATVPRPVVNGGVPTTAGLEEVDFHWPAAMLVVETDGARYHASRWRRRRDAEKDARLRLAGWTVRRFAELEVALAPDAVAAETRRLHTEALARAQRV